MAFTVIRTARLPLFPPFRAGRITTLQASLHAADRPVAPPYRAFDTGLRPDPFPDRAASLLPGLLTATRTGLTPASDDEHEQQDHPATSRGHLPAPLGARRVGSWRGGDVLVLGPEALMPAGFPSGCPTSVALTSRSVSNSRPSNRACGSPAHGSPTSFTAGIRCHPPGPEGPGCSNNSIKADQPEAVR